MVRSIKHSRGGYAIPVPCVSEHAGRTPAMTPWRSCSDSCWCLLCTLQSLKHTHCASSSRLSQILDETVSQPPSVAAHGLMFFFVGFKCANSPTVTSNAYLNSFWPTATIVAIYVNNALSALRTTQLSRPTS